MLTRAVQRRSHLRFAQHATERIQLPWLCPALWSSHTTYSTTRSHRRTIARRPIIERSQSAACLSTNARNLASAAPVPGILDTEDEYASFELQQRSRAPPRSYSLPPLAHDLSKVLLIDQTTSMGPEVLDSGMKKGFIRGNAWEVEATLDACLQIHRWDRALSLLTQLRSIYAANQPQLQRLYNKVLEAMVYDHIWNRSSENVGNINGWVENQMKKAQVQPDAQTFALKIKAAMATLQGRKRDRTVRRYWDMAKDYNVDWEVASLREILSDSDLGKISEISPLEFEAEEVDDSFVEENHISVPEHIVSQPALPSVRETAQRGLGMSSLKRSLNTFNDPAWSSEWENVRHLMSETREAYARQRQLQVEQDSLASAVDRWRVEHQEMSKMGIGANLAHGKIGAILWTWHEQLERSIEEELEKVTEAESSSPSSRVSEQGKLRTEYGPFLRLLDSKTLAALTTTSVIHIMTKRGIDRPLKLATLVTEVGRIIEHEVETQARKQRGTIKMSTRQASNKSRPNPEADESVQTGQDASKLSPRIYWSVAQHAKLGSVLCELLFDTAKIGIVQDASDDGPKMNVQQMAFDRKVNYVNGKRFGMVSLHPEVISLLTKEPAADVLAKQLPMVCRPKPWTSFSEGGYLESQNDVVRIKFADAAQKEYARAAAERGDLDQLFKGLDVLGNTGWRVNQDVFKVMLDAWNSGEAIANLPPLEKVFPDIPKPASDATPREKFNHYKQMQAIHNEKGGLHSNRCFQNFQMEIAKAYLNETFYLPHNVDFRGRAYPIPPYLNQMGADNARGLLVFDKGRELGDKGLRWLKVHLANVCGYDKASLTDRAQFADSHMDDVRDSVSNPLDGQRWWLQAEDPWQCLATCHELVKAIDSGNPTAYVSHLPVHQDGTCNGLQHYAALGGDIAGARQVNLEPGDKPADVYTGVAEMVKADIKQDAEAGDKLAKVLDGRVTRKIVKQTVMTNVYGVTFTGAMAQVRKQLDDLLPDLKQQKLSRSASVYIAKKIFKGLGTLFGGAHDIQYWFGDCATRITSSISLAQLEEISSQTSTTDTRQRDRRRKANNTLAERKTITSSDFRSTIVWTTPLKLPVVQPYRISRAESVKTHMASLLLSEPHATDSVDKRKQLQAFPPNFIHSLDATHMMLSALQAHEQGLTFSAVHDSFWTHAADIDALNLLLRDAFIRMHTEDIVGRLAEEFNLRYKGHIYLARIGEGSDLAQKIREYRTNTRNQDQVTTSTKKGKQGAAEKRRQYWELMQEHKRQKLLCSTDPKEVEKGEKMVTAASLFDSLNGDKYLKARSSLGETALGNVPESQQDPDNQVIEQALQHDEIAGSHDIDMSSTLEPLIEAEEEAASDEDTALLPIIKTKRKIKSEVSNTMWLWLPLTFKPIPPKGDWDVKRLKDSVYFFS